MNEFQQSPQILNTPLPNKHQSDSILNSFIQSVDLGKYAILELKTKTLTSIQIVVCQNFPWLDKSLQTEFGTIPKNLKLSEIKHFIEKLISKKHLRFGITSFLGLRAHKNISDSTVNKLYYLDDLTEDPGHHPLVTALLTMVLIERHTKMKCRIIHTESNDQISLGILLKSKRSLHYCSIHRSTIKFYENISVDQYDIIVDNSLRVRALPGHIKVIKPRFSFDEKEKQISIIPSNGRETHLKVLGRTPAEKRFKNEQKQFDKATDLDNVPVEIGFHPFWRALGHTTLRVGNSLFELSSEGWKIHSSGPDSARAFLFNNPFMKEQFKKHKKNGMPPLSIAVTIMVPKYKVIRLLLILQNLVSARGFKKERFSLFFNNCNQGIMRVLCEAGIPGFDKKGYIGFSSVLSFRKLILNPPLPRKGVYIYPLPGSEITEDNLRLWIPSLIYKHNSKRREIIRAIPDLIVEAVSITYDRVKDKVYSWLSQWTTNTEKESENV